MISFNTEPNVWVLWQDARVTTEHVNELAVLI